MNTDTQPAATLPVHPRPKGRTPTVYEIKAAQPAQNYFFTRASMKFFGQTLKCFSVGWNTEFGAWETRAGMWDRDGKYVGVSLHLWEARTFRHLGTPAVARLRA